MNHLEKLFKKEETAELLKDKDQVVEAAITALSTVCATDFKASEIEVGICSSSSTSGEKGGEGSSTKYRKLSEDEIEAYLTSISEKD